MSALPVGGDESKAPLLNGVVWAFAALSTLVYLGRIYTRARITTNLGIEDVIISFSMLVLYTLSSLYSVSTSFGFGRHQYYLTYTEVSQALKYEIIAIPFGIFGPTLPKISITLTIIHILRPSRLATAWLWLLNIALLVISAVCASVIFIECTPASAIWNPVGNYSCWVPWIIEDIGTLQGATAAFTDFALALFSIPTLLRLRLEAKKKIGVVILTSLGVFTGVAAIVRTTQLAILRTSDDYTWKFVSLVMWVSLETNITIICACIPAMRPLWRLWLGKIPISNRSTTQYTRTEESSRGRNIKMQEGYPLQEQNNRSKETRKVFDTETSTYISHDTEDGRGLDTHGRDFSPSQGISWLDRASA